MASCQTLHLVERLGLVRSNLVVGSPAAKLSTYSSLAFVARNPSHHDTSFARRNFPLAFPRLDMCSLAYLGSTLPCLGLVDNNAGLRSRLDCFDRVPPVHMVEIFHPSSGSCQLAPLGPVIVCLLVVVVSYHFDLSAKVRVGSMEVVVELSAG